MYKVVINCNGKIAEILESKLMSSRDVYETALANIKGMAHMERTMLSIPNRYRIYDAAVYKDDEFIYLLSSTTGHFDWIGITRATDLKTCVIRSRI